MSYCVLFGCIMCYMLIFMICDIIFTIIFYLFLLLLYIVLFFFLSRFEKSMHLWCILYVLIHIKFHLFFEVCIILLNFVAFIVIYYVFGGEKGGGRTSFLFHIVWYLLVNCVIWWLNILNVVPCCVYLIAHCVILKRL